MSESIQYDHHVPSRSVSLTPCVCLSVCRSVSLSVSLCVCVCARARVCVCVRVVVLCHCSSHSGSYRPLPPAYGEYSYLPPQRWLHALKV